MPSIQPQNRQSNLDLVLQAHGGFDKLISFCKSNGVRALEYPAANVYNFSENDVTNRSVAGYQYATGVIRKPVDFYISDDTLDFYISDSGESYITDF